MDGLFRRAQAILWPRARRRAWSSLRRSPVSGSFRVCVQIAGQETPVRCHTGRCDSQALCFQAASAGDDSNGTCKIPPSGGFRTESVRMPGRFLVPLWGRLGTGGVTPAAVRL